MTSEMHDLGYMLAALIIAALLAGLALRAFSSKLSSIARVVANLLANLTVMIFTGTEALQAFHRGGVFFMGLGVILALVTLFAAALAAVLAWALVRDGGVLANDDPTT